MAPRHAAPFWAALLLAFALLASPAVAAASGRKPLSVDTPDAAAPLSDSSSPLAAQSHSPVAEEPTAALPQSARSDISSTDTAALYGPPDASAQLGEAISTTPEASAADIAAVPRTRRRGAAAIVSMPAPDPGTSGAMFQPMAATTVTVYEHCGFGGRAGTVSGDLASIVSPWNDFISSIRVPAGRSVVLYEHANYKGRSLTITGPADIDCLNRWNFNDITTSIKFVTTPGPDTSFAGQLLRLVNDARARSGLRALSLDTRLNAAAQAHSNDMARNRFMGHTGSDGSSFGVRAARAGYRMGAGAENVAAGYRDAPSVFKGWMDSPGHRANIMGPSFVHMGAACTASDANYCTQVFAAPA